MRSTPSRKTCVQVIARIAPWLRDANTSWAMGAQPSDAICPCIPGVRPAH